MHKQFKTLLGHAVGQENLSDAEENVEHVCGLGGPPVDADVPQGLSLSERYSCPTGNSLASDGRHS